MCNVLSPKQKNADPVKVWSWRIWEMKYLHPCHFFQLDKVLILKDNFPGVVRIDEDPNESNRFHFDLI